MHSRWLCENLYLACWLRRLWNQEASERIDWQPKWVSRTLAISQEPNDFLQIGNKFVDDEEEVEGEDGEPIKVPKKRVHLFIQV